MMLLAGIDEAGLGPVLGPMLTASAALLVPDDWEPASPWERLAPAVRETWSKKNPATAVADSKEIHKAGGMRALETAVGVFSLLANGSPEPESPRAAETESAPHPCYAGTEARFPVCIDVSDLERESDAVSRALDAAGARAVHLQTVRLHETAFNDRCASGLNKNQILLRETGGHLKRLVEKFTDCPIVAVVDKQGGRNDYLPFLTGLFPGAWIETLESGAAASVYRMRRRGGDVRLYFRAKADRTSFPTALASMAAKYERERAMTDFNAWFCNRIEGLKTTAGYPEDAKRWLAEVRKREAECQGELLLDLVVRKR